MHEPTLFNSFFLGGYECSTHRRDDGRRLDLIESTAHGRFVTEDYRAMLHHGLRTVRDGVRWHLVETTPGCYDWSSFLPMLRAAEKAGIQVIWDLCHYGWPDDIDIWRPQFVERFARFAAAVARLVMGEIRGVPYYCPINEISYWSWAGGDTAQFNPLARGRGFELKHQLVRASVAAMEAIRGVDPRARFVHAEPLINVVAQSEGDREAARHYHLAQYQTFDMLSGEMWPGLGGKPEYLDVLGLNYYPDNQWFLGGDTIAPDHSLYRPLRELLADTHRRYGRPMLIAETGCEHDGRASWLSYVAKEVASVLENDVPIEGVCLYPIADYPGWANDRHCQVGLFSLADHRGHRPVYRPLAEELARQQARFAAPDASEAMSA